MEQNFDTSFIPKRPIFKEEAGVRRHAPIPVVTLVGFAIFFAALIVTGTVFYLHQKESASVATLATQLATEKEQFNPQAIEELKAISARLKSAKEVVDNHTAISSLLDLVQATTIKSVYYEALALSKEDKTGFKLLLRGKAPSFGLLYAQMSAYRAEPKITSVDISGTQLDERTSGVSFEVSLGLSPEVMKYIPAAPVALVTEIPVATGSTTP